MSGFFRASARLVPLLFVIIAAGCNYGLQGGGGFPSEIRTIYIAPLNDQSGRLDVPPLLLTAMNEQIPRALGLRLAPERSADALVRGTVMRYEDAAQNYRPGEPGNIDIVQHQVQITVSIQIIDVRRNEILYEQSSVSGRGEYQPGAQSEDIARTKAIETLIQQIINGAQSQW